MNSSLRKWKYRLRRFFHPRRHLREVREIRTNQLLLIRINSGIERYHDMMSYGLLGDTLWYNYRNLMAAKKYYEHENRKLKEKVRENYR